MHDQCIPERRGPKPRPIIERFREKVSADGPLPEQHPEFGNCWVWVGGFYHDGYGYFTVRRDGKAHMLRAHRLAFELAYGPIPDGMLILHTCDNPACVRNDDEGWYEVNGVLLPRRGHLVLGTVEQNVGDKVTKGHHPRGDRHYLRQETPHEFAHERRSTHATLTGDQIREIRRRYAEGDVLQKSLAAQYGVSKQAISKIVRGERWPHIEEDARAR